MNTKVNTQEAAPQENPLFNVVKTDFFFRKDAEGKKRETITLPLQFPTSATIIEIFEAGNEKGINKILGLMADAVTEHARGILTDNPTMTADNFPVAALGWAAYESATEAERRINGISQALWDSFKADFINVMPGITGLTTQEGIDRVKNAAKKLIDQRLAQDKTNKPMLQALYARLAMYAEKAPNAENYAECIKALETKITTFLEFDESKLVDLV